MRYSPSLRGFFPELLTYAALPPDLVEISDDYHAELLAAQRAGKEIMPGTDGVPLAVDPQPLAAAVLRDMMVLSFTQLLIGLDTEGWLTTAEADGWLDGTLPAPVLAVIDALPADQRFAARARAKRPTIVERLNPLVVALAAAAGKSDADLDAFFATYAAV